MKSLYFVLAFLLLMQYSCSDRNSFRRKDTGQLKRIPGKNMIEVYPGPDDSRALLDAFKMAKEMGKGAVVKLMPGEFQIGMIESREFYGTLMGSGKDKTFITNLPGLTPDADTALNKLPALLTFIGGDITVSDLTLRTTEDSISWLDDLGMSLILFSDYAADFTPAEKHITVNINNIDLKTTLQHMKPVWFTTPDTSFILQVIMAPVLKFCGIKIAPDVFHMSKSGIKRTHADVNISNSFFSGLGTGVYMWGCGNGQVNIGVQGGNQFLANHWGIRINYNLRTIVKVENNIIKVADFMGNCLDINSGESADNYNFDDVATGELGDYKVQNNTFYIGHRAAGIGMMDIWRLNHPDNPVWFNVAIQNNLFYSEGPRAYSIFSVNMKNSLIINNTISGKFMRGGFEIQGTYFLGNHSNDINYFSEGMKILNNKVLQEDFIIDIKWDVKDCLLGGDLSNVFIADQGINTRFIGLYKNGKPTSIGKDNLDEMWKRYYGKK